MEISGVELLLWFREQGLEAEEGRRRRSLRWIWSFANREGEDGGEDEWTRGGEANRRRTGETIPTRQRGGEKIGEAEVDWRRRREKNRSYRSWFGLTGITDRNGHWFSLPNFLPVWTSLTISAITFSIQLGMPRFKA